MREIENKNIKEKCYMEKLENGLQVIIIPKKEIQKKYDYFSSGRHHRRNGNCYKRKRKYRKCGHFR